MSELEIWNELGNIYYNAGAYDEAVRAYHRAIELGQCYGQSFSNLADIYIRKGFFGEAILMYQQGIEHLKNSLEKASLWNCLADVYLQLDRYDEAIQAYQVAVDLDPDNEELRDDLAKITLGSAHRPEAAEALQPETKVEIRASEPVLSATEAVSAPVSIMEAVVKPELTDTFALETGSVPAFLPEAPALEAEIETGMGPDQAIPQELEVAVAPVELLDEPAWLRDEAVVDLVPEPALEIEAWEDETIPQETDNLISPETQEPLAASELTEESAWSRLEGILASIPDTAAETVEEADVFPPLPAEFRVEQNWDDFESFSAGPVALESEMETEAALKVAAFLSDLPEADPISPDMEAPCWVFQAADSAARVEAQTGGLIEKEPVVLGSRLLSEEADFSPAAELVEEAAALALPVAELQPEELLYTLEGEAAPGPENQNFNDMLASALPPNFEIPFRLEQPDKTLPLIEPRMGEPMNSKAGALVRVGLHRWHQNDYEGGVQFLITALNLAGVFFDHPFEALCYYAIALVETDMGNTDEAVRAYENAACLDPEDFHPWKEIGFLYSQSSRYEEALESFKKAIEANPNDPLSWNGLGDVYHKLGQAEDAISAYQLGNVFDRAARNAPEPEPQPKSFEAAEVSPRVLEEMGNINFLNSEYDDAIHAYSDAIERLESPTDKARLWRRLGDAYHRLNEEDNAKAACQQALNLDSAALPLQNSLAGSELLLASQSFERVDPVAEENLPVASAGPVFAAPEPAELQEPAASVMVDPEPATQADVTQADEDTGEPAAQPQTGTLEPDEPIVLPAVPEPVLTVEEPSIEPMPAEEESWEDEPFSPRPEPVLEPEPEAAYWFYRSSEPVRPLPEPAKEPARSGAGFKLSSDSSLGAVKPSPSFVLPKYSNQARLDKPLVSEAFDDPTVMVMEDTSENETGTRLNALEPSVLLQEETRPISIADLDALWDEEQAADRLEGNAVEETQSSPAAAGGCGMDSHTLENDIVAYRRVTEINPLNDRAWDALGNMYEATGLHSEAIAAFEKAISLASQREVYHYHLGLAHAAQRNYDRAIQSLQKVVALNPDYVLAHCALAGYYRRTGKEAEAREHMVIARPYMESENYYNQACFESICGNTDRAFAFLKNALEKKQVEVELVRTDPDLDFIRQDPRFEAVVDQKDAVYQVVS